MSLAGRHLSHRVAAEYGTGGRFGWQSANSMVHNPSGCRIILSVALENGSCIFTVTDDGKGMSEDRLQELNQNESITSTQESTDDTEHGLGLKIVRQIVKAHNGTVHFSEAHPQGLCVRIILPAVNEIP